jgi:hypothetical protein
MTLLREAYYTLYFFIFASFSLVAVKRTGDEVEVINVPLVREIQNAKRSELGCVHA